jgi:hypothetical protein
MSISHELSGEIAAALVAAKERSPRELKDLKDMLFEIHSTLEQLTQNDRQVPDPLQSASKSSSETNTNIASAASG